MVIITFKKIKYIIKIKILPIQNKALPPLLKYNNIKLTVKFKIKKY